MSTTATVATKKPTIVVRTFAADLERVRNEKPKSPIPVMPPAASTHLPTIHIRSASQSARTQVADPKKTPITESTDQSHIPTKSPHTPVSKTANPAPTIHIRHPHRPSIPKPVIVEPTVKPPLDVAPKTPAPIPPSTPHPPRTIAPNSVVRLAPLPESTTRVTMGSDETDGQAIIITDTKHKRFKAGRSIRQALGAWVTSLFKRRPRAERPAAALVAASERQDVIKRATTQSGLSATARDTALTKRVHERRMSPLTPIATTAEPSVPEPHHSLTWSAQNEPGYPLLEPTKVQEDSQPAIPNPTVTIQYKKISQPTTLADSTDASVKIIPRPKYIPPAPDPTAETRWQTSTAPEPTVSVPLPTEPMSTPPPPVTLPPPTVPVVPLTTTDQPIPPTPAPAEPLPKPIIVKPVLTEATPLPTTPVPVAAPLPHPISPPPVTTTPVVAAPPTKPIVPSTPIAKTPPAPLPLTSTPVPNIPTYTKRQTHGRLTPRLTKRFRELILDSDTNVLTLMIVGVVIGVGVCGVSIWLLLRTLVG